MPTSYIVVYEQDSLPVLMFTLSCAYTAQFLISDWRPDTADRSVVLLSETNWPRVFHSQTFAAVVLQCGVTCAAVSNPKIGWELTAIPIARQESK